MHIREVIFLVFFLLARLHFQPAVFLQTLGLIVVYMIARVIGKIGGTAAGTSLAGAPQEVRKYLGDCLLPQAGVAIGVALKAVEYDGRQDVRATLMNIILGSTIIFELTAPVATKWAIATAGESQGEERLA